MGMKDLTTLREAVLKLRRERYPDLPERLVLQILDIEVANVEDRARAREGVQAAVADHLDSSRPS